MITEVFPAGPFETNAMIIGCSNTKKAAIIDPAPSSSDSLLLYIEEQKLQVEAIYLTHSHWDHIGDVALLKEKLGLPINKDDVLLFF